MVVGLLGMPVSVSAVLVGRRRVLPGLFVLPVGVMMGGLEVMMGGGVMVCGRLMMMLGGWVLLRPGHGAVLLWEREWGN